MSISGRRFLLTIGAVALTGMGVLAWRSRCGVEVTVENEESFDLSDVEVRTSAGAYALGDVASGGSAGTTIGVLGESSVGLAWTSPDGGRHEADADVYIEGTEAGTRTCGGTVDFAVTGGSASSKHRIYLTINPLSRRRPPEPRR